MRLHSFEGLRYSVEAGDAGSLAAPPYDQINDAARDRFHAGSPYQFVHLTRPVAPPAAHPAATQAPGQATNSDPYRHAAELHASWLAGGIIRRDGQPCLYPYVIALREGGRRLGVMALVDYEDASVIRPHEETLDKPLADRTALLAATRVDLEPVLLLAEDGGAFERLLAEDLAPGGAALGSGLGAGQLPLVDHPDSDGHHHLLYRIEDPTRIRRYQEALAGRPAAIADGHHRYKVGQSFAREHGVRPGTAAAAKLAVVTSMESPALTIDPIHRALAGAADLSRAAGLVTARQRFSGAGGAVLAAAVAEAPQPALGVWVHGGEPEIWRLAPPPGRGPALVVKIFQDALLPALGLPPQVATDGTLIYRSDAGELFSQVAGGALGTGFWLPPMAPADFAAAIAGGEMLPPKSTRFLPKVMSGLVWADHGTRVS